MSQGVYVLGGKCPGGKCPGVKCPWGKCPGGTSPGGLCPRTPRHLSPSQFMSSASLSFTVCVLSFYLSHSPSTKRPSHSQVLHRAEGHLSVG